MQSKSTIKYSLQVCNSNIAREWHPTKNGSLTPCDVSVGSNRKVWWLCSKGHAWPATVSERNQGSGCPYCSDKKVKDENSLQTVNPSLAKEWHPTKNGSLTPRDVTANSHNQIWWLCSKGHEWKAAISSRSNGQSCFYCSYMQKRKR